MIGGAAPGQLYPGGDSVIAPTWPQLISNPSFEGDTIGGAPALWTQFLANSAPTPTTLAVQSGWASDGAKSCRITTATHTANNQAVDLIQSGIAAVPGAVYQLSADFDILAMPTTMIARVLIEWHDAANAFISQSLGNAVTALGVGRSFVLGTAPSNAATGRAIIIVTGGTGVADLYVDNIRDVRVLQRENDATQSQTPTLTLGVSRKLSVTQSQAVAIDLLRSRAMAPTQSQAVVIGRQIGRSQSATQSQAPSLRRDISRTLSVTQSQTVSAVRQGSRSLTPTQSQALSVARQIGRSLALTQAQALSVVRRIGRAVAFTQAQVAATVRQLARVATVTQAQTLSRTALNIAAKTTAQTQALAAIRLTLRTVPSAQSQALAQPRAITRTCSVTQAATATMLGGRGRLVVLSLTQSSLPSRGAIAVAACRLATQDVGLNLRRNISSLRSRSQSQTPRLVRRPTITTTATQAQLTQRIGAATILKRTQAQAVVIVHVAMIARAVQPSRLTVTRDTPAVVMVGQDQTVGFRDVVIRPGSMTSSVTVATMSDEQMGPTVEGAIMHGELLATVGSNR